MTNFFFYTTMVVFLFVCLILILLVLIQKGRGGGLASAFGGAGGNTAFGSKTGDVLTWATSIVFGVFLVLAVGLNLLANQIGAKPLPVVGATPTAVQTPTTVPSNSSSTTVPPIPGGEIPTTTKP